MDNKNKRLCVRSLSEEDTEEDYTGMHIDNLPEEMFLKILGYLPYDDLHRAGGVCKKWYALTKCPLLWTRVDVSFSRDRQICETTKKFIDVLPAYVSHLRLNFELSEDRILDFTEVSKKLQATCPNLQVLVFHRAMLTDYYRSLSYFDEGLIVNIRILAIHHCSLQNVILFDCNMDEIMIKDIPGSSSEHDRIYFPYFFLSKLRHLEKLCLARSDGCEYIFVHYPYIVSPIEVLDLEGSNISPVMFAAIRSYGHHLAELYVCFTSANDDELLFTKSTNVLPCLKIICLRATFVTCRGVSSLVEYCKSLKAIYVGNRLNDCFYDYANCCPEKVHIINSIKHCNHYNEKRYMTV